MSIISRTIATGTWGEDVNRAAPEATIRFSSFLVIECGAGK